MGSAAAPAVVRRALASNKNANDEASLAAREAHALPKLRLNAAAAGVIFSEQNFAEHKTEK
jgi:hypothetical protein